MKRAAVFVGISMLAAWTLWPYAPSALRSARAEEFIYLGSGPMLGDRVRELRTTQAPPTDWRLPSWDDRTWTLTKDEVRGMGLGTADGGMIGCQGTLYVRRRFDVGAELSRLTSLTLRVHYEDGLAVYLNGVEVIRRRLKAADRTDATTLATERAPVEPESYFIPVTGGVLHSHDNLLALEVHPRNAGGCPRLSAELSAAEGAHVVRGPYIEWMGDTSIDLAVESDVSTAMDVRYGKGSQRSSADRYVHDPLAAVMHRVRLTGLRPGTSYHYQVSLQLPSGGQTDVPEVSFQTPPAAGRPLRFVVYGDSRSGHAVHAQVVRSILADAPDSALNTGDVVDHASEEGEWDRFFTVAAPLLQQVPVYLTPGNHEYASHGVGAQRLFDLFSTMFPSHRVLGVGEWDGKTLLGVTSPGLAMARFLFSAPPRRQSNLISEGERGYYSFDMAGVHFATLDSNQYRSASQRTWLAKDLRLARVHQSRAVFVWTHFGPYSAALHGDNALAIRDYVPLMERYGVNLVFSGHDHNYERGHRGQLSYIVTGGAGAELRPLRCGVPGMLPCANQPAALFNEHHYVVVDVLPDEVLVCPKQKDGTPLEPCQTYPLPPADGRAASGEGERCGSPVDCYHKAVDYLDGRGVSRNPARAVPLFEHACTEEVSLACRNLGIMYADGRGVTKDEARAAGFFEDACDLGDAAGCSNLGGLYALGRGVPRDEQRAVEFLRKGCERGDPWACAKLE